MSAFKVRACGTETHIHVQICHVHTIPHSLSLTRSLSSQKEESLFHFARTHTHALCTDQRGDNNEFEEGRGEAHEQ